MHKIKQTKQCAQCESLDPSYSLGQCEHHLCQNCFKQILTNTIQSKKSKFQIKCPIDSCKKQIDLKELLKYLTLPNTCKRCNLEQSYTCGQCLVKEIEEIAKINYYSKLLNIETLINLETQKELHEEIIRLELICPICREFNQIPIIVCMQGHEICKHCYYNIRNIEDVRQACPICKQELLTTPPNSLRAQVQIKNLSIKCPNDNCKQVVKYPEFVQNHYRNCCEQKIECLDCHDQVEQLFQEIHQQNYCMGGTCPFNCTRKLRDHKNNFIMEHIQSTMRQSDVAQSFLVRMQMVEKFLFRGTFGSCPQCDLQYAWQVDVRGIKQIFCFYCFQFTG